MIVVERINEVYMKVSSDPGIEQELKEYFTFQVPGYKFMPSFKRGTWDGKLRLYNPRTKQIYAGLLQEIQKFAEDREYNIQCSNEFMNTPLSLSETKQFLQSVNPTLQPRDYQIKAFTTAIRSNRRVLLSPTASGKSFIIYLIAKYYSKKTLFVVPTTALVHQLASDFKSYGYVDDCHLITSGKEKNTDKEFIISTWQSIFKMPQEWFDQFEVVVCDEVHLAKAASLTKIMCNLVNCKYRFGFTGTLDGTQTNKLVIEGLFGPVSEVTTTSKLIEEQHLADFRIKCIVFDYDDETKKAAKKLDYQQEIDFLISNTKRNKFIVNLAESLSGNTLILFQYIEKHGDVLHRMLQTISKKPLYYIHGGIDGEDRNNVREIVESQQNAIIVASVQTFSTGINIKNLENIIFASPSKSRVRTLQSIGRVLRKSETKTQSTLFDISDDLTWKSHRNYTILHYIERVKIYNQEKFPYKVYRISI
ncbi:DEAD/DEAH box helicase [bacterium]|nr:DEAD/DEAH box helicase [Candidatus Elulimicrobium humile]